MKKQGPKKPTLGQWTEASKQIEIEDPEAVVETVNALREAVGIPPIILTITVNRSTGFMEIASNVRAGEDGLQDLNVTIAALKDLAGRLETQAKELEIEIRVAQAIAPEAPAEDSQEE